MKEIEEMARELVSVVRCGPMRDAERMELAIRSYEYGLLCGMNASARSSPEQLKNPPEANMAI